MCIGRREISVILACNFLTRCLRFVAGCGLGKAIGAGKCCVHAPLNGFDWYVVLFFAKMLQRDALLEVFDGFSSDTLESEIQ